jgi:hypothetical protein
MASTGNKPTKRKLCEPPRVFEARGVQSTAFRRVLATPKSSPPEGGTLNFGTESK